MATYKAALFGNVGINPVNTFPISGSAKIISKMNEKEEKLNEVQKKKQYEIKEKHNVLVMKEVDKRENVERIMKMHDYQREKVMEKIERDNEKAKELK